jgi:hypothetical protein
VGVGQVWLREQVSVWVWGQVWVWVREQVWGAVCSGGLVVGGGAAGRKGGKLCDQAPASGQENVTGSVRVVRWVDRLV